MTRCLTLSLALLVAMVSSVAFAAEGEVDYSAAMLTEPTELKIWLAVLPIVLPLLGAAITLTFRHLRAWQSFIALAFLAASTVAAVALNAVVGAEGPLVMAVGNWLPPFGIVIAVDALGALFVLLTSVVGLIGLAYARAEVESEGVRYGFYSFYLLLIAGVCGAFSTGDIFNLYVWFEVFLISSFGLIVLGGAKVQMDGAVKYGVLNLIATTIFLIAVGALYGLTGTLNMADIQTIFADAPAGPIATIGALFVLAFAMKAAAFPLHFWLPASYPAPKIIVAALFAGLLTKVGVYSLLRVMIMLYGEAGAMFGPFVALIGVSTAILGALGALAQNDLKRVAAFLVVSGIGLMLIGFGLGTEEGLTGAVVYAAHSILVMTALFLVLGITERLAGHASLGVGANLYATHGFLATLYLVVAFAVAGLPPFSGFWAKLMLLRATLIADGTIAVLGAVAIILSGILTTIVLGRVWVLTFLRPAAEDAPDAPAGSSGTGAMTTSLALLAALVLGIGLFPSMLLVPAADGAAGLLDPSRYVASVLEINGETTGDMSGETGEGERLHDAASDPAVDSDAEAEVDPEAEAEAEAEAQPERAEDH